MVAVITGDINSYSNMTEKDARQLENLLKKCYKTTLILFKDADLKAFSNFRGDSWQFIVGNPVMAIRATLLFRSLLIVESDKQLGRVIQTSAAIGFGNIDFLPNANSLSGKGEAYKLSGKKLDKLKRQVPGMGIVGLGKKNQFLDSYVGLIDALIHKWTAAQALASSYALQTYSQKEIAEKWTPPITQQAVSKHLKAAGWPAIKPALQEIETTIKGC